MKNYTAMLLLLTLAPYNTNGQMDDLSEQTWDNALGSAFLGYENLTDSLNSAGIEETFGAGGLNIKASKPKVFNYIKNFYAYMDILVKYEKGSPEQKIIILRGLQSLKQLASISNTTTNPSEKKQAENALKDVNTTLKDIASKINITNDDIKASVFWQQHLKYTITQLFEQLQAQTSSAHSFQLSLYKYLPNFDTAIHQSDCRNSWYAVDFLRHYFVLLSIIIERSALSCAAWKHLAQNFQQLQEQQVKPFKETSFYRALSNPQQYFPEKNNQHTVDAKKIATLGPIDSKRVTGISMVVALQNQLKDFFTTETLESTMDVLDRSTLQPSIVPYLPEDYVYLSALSDTKRSVKKTTGQTREAVSFEKDDRDEDLLLSSLAISRDEIVVTQNLLDDAKKGWKKIKKSSEKLAKDTVDVIKNANTGITKAEIGLLTGNTKLMAEASKAFGKSGNGVTDIIKDVGNVAKSGAHVVGAGLSTIASFADPRLGKDLEGTVNSLSDAMIHSLVFLEGLPTSLTSALFRLTFDGARALATFIVGGVQVLIGQKNLGSWGNDFKDIAEDMAAAILDSITFVVGQLKETLTDVVKFIAYFNNTLIDLIIDATRAIDMIVEVRQGDDIKDAWQRTKGATAAAWMENHRRLMFNIVLGIEFAAVTIATAGTGGAAALAFGLSMDFAFAAFSSLGGFEQDEAVIKRKQKQHEFVVNYEHYIDDTKQTMEYSQKSMAYELNKKYATQISNMERSLGFYQNFLSERYKGVSGQIAQNVRSYTMALLTPDTKTGTIPADIGSLYGFTTGWNDFNPGQSFTVYNKGRENYSQEIAVSPETLESFDDTGKIQSKFWFLQKVNKSVSNLNEVEIRWQAIYVLDSFYIGLYLGGKPYETLEQLQAKTDTEINHAHHAKMFVYKKESTQRPVTIGVYEHESGQKTFAFNDGWSPKRISASPFEVGQWYRMKARLSGTSLSVKAWKEGTAEPGWQAFTVTPTDETTLGIIYSGASIEFDVISPSETIAPIAKIRGMDRGQDEEERELDIRAQQQKSMAPLFGIFKLQALGKYYIMKDQFVYRTQQTSLKKDGVAIDDYVIFAHKIGISFENLGERPSKGNCIVSLISGKVFDNQAQVLGTVSNVLQAYQEQYGVFDDTLKGVIQAKQEAYTKEQQGPFSFGTRTLKVSSVADLQKNVFIYTTNTPETKNLKADDGSTISDYVIMATLKDNTYPTKYGMPYSKQSNGIISLVTGKVYTPTQENTVLSGYKYLFDGYAKTMSKELNTRITNARQAYTAALSAPAPQEENPSSPPQQDVTTVTQSEIKKPPTIAIGNDDPKLATIKPAQSSLKEEQQAAAGNQPTSGGLVISDDDDEL